jgi:hypothetical protein
MSPDDADLEQCCRRIQISKGRDNAIKACNSQYDSCRRNESIISGIMAAGVFIAGVATGGVLSVLGAGSSPRLVRR